MSEEQKNRRKNVRRKKRRLTGASHQGVNQTLVVQIEGEQGENAERRKKTSKKRNVFGSSVECVGGRFAENQP